MNTKMDMKKIKENQAYNARFYIIFAILTFIVYMTIHSNSNDL
jgi:hypothetical protein